MNKNIYIISMIFLVMFTSCESAKLDIFDYGTIEGTVMDGNTYLPVQGVMISTAPASVVLISDINGKFAIPKVLAGDVVVSLKKTDYQSNTLTVAIYGEEVTKMDFLIFKNVDDIGNVTFSDPVPENGAVEQSMNPKLSWDVDVESKGADLSYNVYIFESNSTVQKMLGEGLNVSEVITSGLKAGTTYFWYVVALYKGKKVANSPTWSFKTEEE